MSKALSKTAVEKEKGQLRDDITTLGISYREKVYLLGGRLRVLQEQLGGGFKSYLDTLPISKQTAYNWMNANKRIEEGEDPENVSDLYTLESPKDSSSPKVGLGNKGLMNDSDENESETEVVEADENEQEEPENEPWDEPEEEEIQTTEATVVEPARDRFGQNILPSLTEIFATGKQYNVWRKAMSDVKSEMTKIGGMPGYEGLEKKFIGSRFRNVLELINTSRPYCVCPVCGGDGGLGSVCGYCKGKGWMNKMQYHATPGEFKEGLEVK